MRVALVIGRYDAAGGGAERWTDRHARYLISLGIDVGLIARSFHGVPDGATCHEVPSSPGWGKRLRWGADVEKLLTKEKFDIVHDMGDGWACDLFMPHHGSRQAGQRQNLLLLPSSLRPIQSILQQTVPRYREFAELERRQYSLDRAKRFVAISKRVADDMQQLHGVPSEKIDLVYNGIDTERFFPGTNPALREEWGWSDRTIFLLVAHNFRLKGVREAIDSLAELRGQGEKVALLIAGGGRASSYARHAVKRGVADSVRFLGNIRNILPIYHAADVYVQPTYYDPCSLVVLEALACGLPSITTAINGASELMTSAIGEVISHPKDHPSLVRAMARFLDPDGRRQAGEQARSAMARQTRAANSDRLIQIYRHLRTTPSAAA